VNSHIIIRNKHNTVLVPAAAVQRSSQTSTFVYVVKPDQTVETRIVTIGASEGDLVSIQSGLNPGDIAVTSGTDKLQPGTKVSVQLAADTAPAGNGGARGATLSNSPAGNRHVNTKQTGGPGGGKGE
ncbi:MAG: efflux RND transporter periplasmic adaptor subunit, partial [Candidatus Binataceae bacterium]